MCSMDCTRWFYDRQIVDGLLIVKKHETTIRDDDNRENVIFDDGRHIIARNEFRNANTDGQTY